MPNQVSVYICTYNEENNIGECIKAIRENSFVKIFVVDAISTDGTSKIARNLGVEVLQAQKGLAGQRQKAIEHCDTEYLMFVDADDRIDKNCITALLMDMKEYGYDAVQAKLRVLQPTTYWKKAMDANLEFCLSIPGRTNMVGRPALYRTQILKRCGMDVSFNGLGNEDSALSIRLEKMGAKQGVGSGICYRQHPSTFRANYNAWKKYGLGDANLIRRYPEKVTNIIKHLLYVYPVKRSIILLKNGMGRYVFYTICTGICRFFYMTTGLIWRNAEKMQ